MPERAAMLPDLSRQTPRTKAGTATNTTTSAADTTSAQTAARMAVQAHARTAGPAVAQVNTGDEEFYRIVDDLRGRVATRLATQESRRFARLDGDGRAELTRTLVTEELQAFALHRQSSLGLPGIDPAVEDELIEAAIAAVGGLGRLEPLLKRDDVEDIFFNGTAPTVLRLADGSKVEGPPVATSDADLVAALQNLAASLSGDGAIRELSPANPLLALRLRNVGQLGARMSAAIDVTPHPAGTIRVHRHTDIDLDGMHTLGTLNQPLVALLRAGVLAGAKICVCGGPAFGKTTLLRALANEIPADKMILTIEDDRELGLHVLPLIRDGQIVRDARGNPRPRRPPALVRAYEARPANAEGSGAVTLADLGHQSLRDSPDVVIYGEARGGEIVQMLDAVTNGVAGIMCTIHAESAFGVFERIVQLCRKAHPPMPVDYALRAATSLDLIVHVRRDRHHHRFVSEVIEVASGPLNEDGYPRYERIFTPGPDGRAVATGHPLSPRLHGLLAEVGFDRAWLEPRHSTWDPPRLAPDPATGPTTETGP